MSHKYLLTAIGSSGQPTSTTYCEEHLELALLALPIGSPEYIVPVTHECDCEVCSWEREEVRA